jgi:predicted MFS family arabinose efflux permease
MDRRTLRLIACGTTVIAVAFGLARYGYGLLLPEIRESFSASNATLGLIATGGYVAYLIGNVAAAPLAGARGPRVTVVAGGVVGVAGMALLAVASDAVGLAIGIALSGLSGGLVYPPLGDVIAKRVAPERGSRALAIVSSGTGWGVALSVPVAIAAGADWRVAWLVFAAVGAVVTVWSAFALRTPRGTTGSDPDVARVRLSLSWFLCPRAGPLLLGAFVVGTGASVYWTFGADFVAAGSLPGTAGPMLLACVGVASVMGSGAGDLVERLGGRFALRSTAVLLAASFVVLVAGRESWVLVLVSGIAFGAGYNLVLAVQAIWCTRVFAERPSAGLAGMMFTLGIGQIIGPVIAGGVADSLGTETAFVGGALVVGTAMLTLPREEIGTASAAARA